MTGKTVRMLRRYSLATRTPLADVKREWLDTPRCNRHAVRLAMMRGLWGGKLRAWQEKHDLLQKEAASIIDVPLGTYQDWCDGDSEPTKFTRAEVERRMAAYIPKK